MEGTKETKWEWLKGILGLGPGRVRLVSARIVADEHGRFLISLSRHHGQVPQFEYVRLLLHYYARVLYILNPEDERMIQSAKALKEMMRKIFSRRVDRGNNVLERVGIDGAVTLTASEREKNHPQISLTLYYLSRDQLYLQAEIPKDASLRQVLYSVPALLQSILPELDVRSLNVLNYAVAQMNEAYDRGRSFSELRNLCVVPQEAFESAARLFGQPPLSPDPQNP
jgi:hypothetical protein